MPVAQSAVSAFLKRDLDSFDHCCKWSWDDVERELSKLNPAPSFYTEPYLHQAISFIIGAHRHGFMFFLDMGLGKTKLMLDLFRYHSQSGARRCLVLVPYSTIRDTWAQEADKHAPDLSHAVLDGHTDTRMEEVLEGGAQICISTYMGFVRMCSDTSSKPWTLNKRRAAQLCGQFDQVVFDESTAIRDKASLTFKTCNVLRQTCQYRYGLTGTPFGRDPLPLWSQFYVVDGGATLGGTLGLYRGAFFKEQKNHWSGYPDYVFDKRKKTALSRVIKHRSIRFKDSDWLALPGQRYVKIKVRQSQVFHDYYQKKVQEIRAARGHRLIKNTYLQMRQLTAGYMTLIDEHDDMKHPIFLPENPKLDALIDKVREFPPEEKLIIFNIYHISGDLIEERLEKEKIPYARIYGGTSNKSAELKKFQDGDARVLIGSESAAYGLNLGFCRYTLFFETDDDPIVRQQMEKRTHGRGAGQTEDSWYYDFVVAKSVDEKILRFTAEGRSLMKELVDGRASI